MSWFPGIFQSLIGGAVGSFCGYGYDVLFGPRIRITSPRQNELLSPAEERFAVQAHAVYGKLKYLPKGHKIWLLVVDEGKTKHWPQGFSPVEYDEKEGTWKGYVNAFNWKLVNVAAVIAPPTTQDYFNYFQRVGSKTQYEPIPRIPPECKRIAWLSTKVPPSGT